MYYLNEGLLHTQTYVTYICTLPTVTLNQTPFINAVHTRMCRRLMNPSRPPRIGRTYTPLCTRANTITFLPIHVYSPRSLAWRCHLCRFPAWRFRQPLQALSVPYHQHRAINVVPWLQSTCSFIFKYLIEPFASDPKVSQPCRCIIIDLLFRIHKLVKSVV